MTRIQRLDALSASGSPPKNKSAEEGVALKTCPAASSIRHGHSTPQPAVEAALPVRRGRTSTWPENLAVTALTPKQAVSIALKAMEARQPDREIAQILITAGVDPADAPAVVDSIRLGFQSGVQSKVMGTRAHPDGDPYYFAAFAHGRFAMRFTSPAWVLIRRTAPFVIGGLILAFILWRFVL